jgi:plastocyanin
VLSTKSHGCRLRLLLIKFLKGVSGFGFVLISIIGLAFGCSLKDRPESTGDTPQPNPLATNRVESARIDSETHATGTSSIVGRILYKGRAPTPKAIRMNQDAACAATPESRPLYSEDIVLNPDSTLANVFVYVKAGLRRQPFAAPAEPVILDQHGCRYVPHVFGIQVGQTLKILNSDLTFHNVHAAAKNNRPFNLGMSKVEKVKTRTFDQVEVMIPLQCNVHPWMSAYAGVLDHPFYAVSDSTGYYQLPALPAGEYAIAAWHEVFGALEQDVILREAENKTIDFTFTRR